MCSHGAPQLSAPCARLTVSSLCWKGIDVTFPTRCCHLEAGGGLPQDAVSKHGCTHVTASKLPLNCVVRRLVLYESSLLRLLTMVIVERLCRECSKQMPCNTGPSLDPHPLGLPEDKEVCLACLSLSHNQQGDWQKRKEKARKGGKREGGGKWVIDSSLSTHHSVLISAHACAGH